MQSFYHEQTYRFEPYKPHNVNLTDGVRYYMYWIGDIAANMLLGRKMLHKAGFEVYVLWDMASDEFCLLTNYPSNWERNVIKSS